MDKIIRKNEKCFIGLPSCGYGFESAKLCFVACPSDDIYTLKIDAIKDIVEERQYECHIALKKIDPGNFVFCTKICSKIIQSQFCIALLDPSFSKEDKREFANPNVHLEYGMMMSLNKHIIPLQNEKYKLPFNISPLDTIKYTESNFKMKVTEAIDQAIEKFSAEGVAGPVPPGPEIFTYYNLHGYKISDVNLNFYKYVYNLGSHLGFSLFNYKEKLKFVGPFDYEDPKKAILLSKLLINNLVSTYESLLAFNIEEAKQGRYDYLRDNISIDIIVSPFFDKEDIKGRLNKIIKDKYQYPISILYRKEVKEEVEGEYENIGEIKPIKTPNA